MSTRLRPIVKVTRQASGKTWAVGLYVPNEAYGGHRLDKVLATDFESRKLADQYAKAYRGGKAQP